MRRRNLLALVVGAALAAPLGGQAGSTTTFTHDANGNLTSRTEGGVVWTYVYDASSLLREVQRDGVLLESYQYDAHGRRVRKTSAAGVVGYVWDGERILTETDDFGNTIARYDYAGDRLLAVHHVTERTGFYLLDGLGSPVALLRADGSVGARFKLDAWGVLRVQTGDFPNPFRFTGHLFDEGTGLFYAKARYYDPRTARFLTADPVKGDPIEPASLHPYLYAYANPTVYVDPDGRCVGSLQQSDFCQAIARGMAHVIGGDPEADVARQIERREKVVEARRRFRGQTGREPLPGEVVWSEAGRALTASFQEIDTTGRIEPDHAEWAVVGAGVSTRIAVSRARAAGATIAGQALAGAAQPGDETVGQVTGVSPGDVASLTTRLARQGLAPRPPPGSASPNVRIVSESASRPGVELLPAGEGLGAPSPGTRSAPGPSPSAEKLARWVDEGGNLRAGRDPGMSQQAYDYQSSTPGA